jgi:isoleucyl-tRNA synthetase
VPGKRYNLEGSVIATATGSALELINFRHPFYDRLSPVYLADYVELGAGTGVVHSPAYGVDDFVTKRYGMVNDDILNPVQSNGVYVPRCHSSAASSSGRPTRPSSTS